MSAYVITALLAASLPHAAMAQSADLAPAAVPPAVEPVRIGAALSHWLVSGFVGSNFGKSTQDPNIAFGGQAGYLWKGIIGGEAIADFAPSFKLTNPALSENPRANSYMANAVFAMPLGAEGQIQPYVSGGLGWIQLTTRVFNAALPHVAGTPLTGTSDGNEMHGGTNFGGGLMGFGGTVGFRADVRYYKAGKIQTLQSTTPAGQYTETLLSSLDFWRANIGVVLRF
jgi:hypothetical protein